MKNFQIFISILLFPFLTFSQTVIWEENFDNQVGKGVTGDGSGGLITDFSDVNWTLDYSNCTFENEDDFVRVDKYFSGGRFEAKDCNGEAIWESESIAISDYANIEITAKIGETGSSDNTSAKYIKIYTVVDGTENPFAENGEGLGNFGSATAKTTLNAGSQLKIRVKLRSDFAQDVYFDEIEVVEIVLDDTPPKIESLFPSDKNQLQLTFNEPIDTLSIKKTQNFFLNGIGYPQSVNVSDDGTQIWLNFSENFSYGTTYEVEIKEILDLSGNALENTTASFALPEIALNGELVLNEILFNPVADNVDYVELYNNSAKTFDLATLFIATRDKNNELKTVYPMSESSRLLQPNDFVVLTTSPTLVEQQYYVENPDAMLKTNKLPSFPNDAGIVVILNQENEIIDEFHYDEAMHSAFLYSTDGVALERINYNLPTQDANNWHSASESSGFGTPTYKNSAYSDAEITDNSITISPKVFSPDGNGINDEMQIHYQFESAGKVANVRIFDSLGRLVLVLTRNLTLGTEGIITWDGTSANNERAKTGRYVILIEIFDEKGYKAAYKRSCVLNGLSK